jgi:hypothetical protein
MFWLHSKHLLGSAFVSYGSEPSTARNFNADPDPGCQSNADLCGHGRRECYKNMKNIIFIFLIAQRGTTCINIWKTHGKIREFILKIKDLGTGYAF